MPRVIQWINKAIYYVTKNWSIWDIRQHVHTTNFSDKYDYSNKIMLDIGSYKSMQWALIFFKKYNKSMSETI